MKKIRVGIFLGVALGLLAFGWSMPNFAQAAQQTLCPVLGNKIDKNVYVDYHGQRIYFCCPRCKAAFKKNPQKYLSQMEAQGVTLAKSPAEGQK
jgi:YHS domain-containing protein